MKTILIEKKFDKEYLYNFEEFDEKTKLFF